MTRPWSSEEKAFLLENHDKLSYEEIGRQLGRTEGAIRNYCYKHGLRKRFCDWKETEIEQLKTAYANRDGVVDIDQMAARFGRLKSNISRKARELGLTNRNRPRPEWVGKQISQKRKEWLANNDHPRGYLGRVHSSDTRLKLSASSLRAWGNPSSGHHGEKARQGRSDRALRRILAGAFKTGRSRGKAGKRADLDNRFFRSRWEANYARYLNLLVEQGRISGWDYECRTFVFEKIKRGTRAYTPDFKVMFADQRHEWHEVKGWMDQKSRTRLKRMAKYYPDEKVVVIGAEWFRAAKKGIASILVGWEHG